jgi:hypothetical protein
MPWKKIAGVDGYVVRQKISGHVVEWDVRSAGIPMSRTGGHRFEHDAELPPTRAEVGHWLVEAVGEAVAKDLLEQLDADERAHG